MKPTEVVELQLTVSQLKKERDRYIHLVNEKIAAIQSTCQHDYETYYNGPEKDRFCKKCDHWA